MVVAMLNRHKFGRLAVEERQLKRRAMVFLPIKECRETLRTKQNHMVVNLPLDNC
jgi:hypothetical protein